MDSTNERSSLIFRKADVLQIKNSAKEPKIKDFGFGFYYPNAVAVSKKMIELVGREVVSDVNHCTIEHLHKTLV